MPYFSIITPAFESATTLGDCVQSVTEQGADCEHLVIEGSGCEQTKDLVRDHAQTWVISGPDEGLYDAMNKGVALATGEVVGILNADDCYATNRVLRLVQAAFDNSSVQACYGDLEYVDGVNGSRTVRRWRAGQYAPASFLNGWMPPHPTFFVRREVYEELGGYRLDLGSAGDYELMLRFLFKNELNAVYIPEVLVRMRTNGVSNRSIGNRLRANRMDRKAWRVNGLKPKPWTLTAKPLRKMHQWFL